MFRSTQDPGVRRAAETAAGVADAVPIPIPGKRTLAYVLALLGGGLIVANRKKEAA